MGVGSAAEAEIWALLYGLRLAWERGVRRLRIEVDSVLVFQWVTSGNGGRNKFSNLIRECKDLLGKGWSHEIRHVYRECNQIANRSSLASCSKGVGRSSHS